MFLLDGESTVLVGDALELLQTVPDGSVRMCITSPPYWGLRDYGHEGQVGLEPTPDEYVSNMVNLFREVRRTLTDDGTLWLNLGDTYYKKQLTGVPWRLALALQADGWNLRQDIIWHKPNPMPESVKDRCVKSHEYVFLLSKSPRYFIDHDHLTEAATGYDGRKATAMKAAPKYEDAPFWPGELSRQNFHTKKHERWRWVDGVPIRNKRSVWTIPTQPFKGAHFAVMPEGLAEPCILAGSQVGDIVLDPFAGSGTSGLISLRHGRRFIGIELNPDYAELAEQRIAEGS